MPRRNVELEVQTFRERIIRLAAEKDTDSDVVVMAIADILGLTSATLTVRGDGISFENRMAAVYDRAKAMQDRTLRRMVAHTTG